MGREESKEGEMGEGEGRERINNGYFVSKKTEIFL
jgi:hypothetical protein